MSLYIWLVRTLDIPSREFPLLRSARHTQSRYRKDPIVVQFTCCTVTPRSPVPRFWDFIQTR